MHPMQILSGKFSRICLLEKVGLSDENRVVSALKSWRSARRSRMAVVATKTKGSYSTEVSTRKPRFVRGHHAIMGFGTPRMWYYYHVYVARGTCNPGHDFPGKYMIGHRRDDVRFDGCYIGILLQYKTHAVHLGAYRASRPLEWAARRGYRKGIS